MRVLSIPTKPKQVKSSVTRALLATNAHKMPMDSTVCWNFVVQITIAPRERHLRWLVQQLELATYTVLTPRTRPLPLQMHALPAQMAICVSALSLMLETTNAWMMFARVQMDLTAQEALSKLVVLVTIAQQAHHREFHAHPASTAPTPMTSIHLPYLIVRLAGTAQVVTIWMRTLISYVQQVTTVKLVQDIQCLVLLVLIMRIPILLILMHAILAHKLQLL